MGAQLWDHSGPWSADPNESLRAIQHAIFAEQYDLPSLVRERLFSAREAVRLTNLDGDPYGLLDTYRQELELLEEINSRPLPSDPDDQVQLLRQVCRYTGEGIGNVLDVTKVVKMWNPGVTYVHVTRVLKSDAVREYCGTDHPTKRQAEQAVFKINTHLSRGESVCFPYYNDAEDPDPAGWYFVGNTID